MRLPWPFARAQRSPSGEPGISGPIPSVPARADGNAWRDVPPLRETIGPPPLVAPNRPFAASLAAENQPPPSILPLAHDRGLEAPRGIVVGIARPSTALAGAALPPPVQRSPLAAGRRGADVTRQAALADWPSSLADDAVGPAGPPVIPGPPATSAAAEAPAMPVRRLAVAERPPRRAPTLSAATTPPDAAGLHGLVGQPVAAGRAPSVAFEASMPPVQRAPDAAAPKPAPAPAGPASPPARGADVPRLTLGQARRIGLGAPIARGPAATRPAAAPFNVGSAPASAVQPEPAVERPIVAAAPIADIPSPAAVPTMEREPAATLRLRAAPATQRAPASPAAELDRAVATTPLPAPKRAATGVPIVSARHLQPTLQRAPAGASKRQHHDRPTPASGPVPETSTRSVDGAVTVHRGSAASELAGAMSARAFTHDGQVYLPSSAGPIGSSTARSLLAHELTHVAQQRRMGSNLPQEHTPHGQALEGEAVAAERAASMPLAPSGRPSPRAEAADAPAAGSTQRAPATAVAAHPPAAPDETLTVNLRSGVQRAANGATSAIPDAGANGSSTGRSKPSDQELEDLAGQLYARIGRRLRQELVVDRERAGFRLDVS